jgi:hypothetical protein
MLESSLPNMVAGKGSERNGPPEFSESDFDGWLLFLKAHLGRMGGADDALEQDYPTTLVDDDGEEIEHPNRPQMRELELLQEEWKVKNRICYGAIMDVCYKNPNAKRVAKRCKSNVAKTLIEMLKKRFQIIQDNVKQSEITIFNTMSIKADETTGSFMDRLIEQAEKLADMGEEVSELRKMTRVKEGLASKYIHLAHSLAMQSDLNWEKLEALVRSYEHSIFAQPSRKTEDDGKVPAAHMAFAKKMRGRDKTTKVCRVCRKPGHLAKDCWERTGKPSGNKGVKGRSEKPGGSSAKGRESRTCFVCGKGGHIAKDCDKRVTKPE